MTTSYELSLKLKELGVEQNGGQYYFYDVNGEPVRLHNTSLMVAKFDVICRAFTLGELVRMLPEYGTIYKTVSGNFIADIRTSAEKPLAQIDVFPEEAAGELLAAIKEQEKQKA